LKRQRKDERVAAPDRLQVEAAQRDRSCFAALYENNFERVYAYIVRRVGDRDRAQDLTADVFHNALANLNRFEWRGVPFVAWLYRIAANAIADGGKRSARLEAFKQIENSEIEEASDGAAENEIDESERRARLYRLVEKLPADQRRVIRLRFGEEKSIAAIAKEMARSEGAIKQLQFRGLQALRTMVGKR
jgi:RNA polymerase sigma-70 factor (ECF subfamily)